MVRTHDEVCVQGCAVGVVVVMRDACRRRCRVEYFVCPCYYSMALSYYNYHLLRPIYNDVAHNEFEAIL